MRHHEGRETRLAAACPPRRCLVPDLAADPGGGARVRRDGRGMVVGLHFHDHVDPAGCVPVVRIPVPFELEPVYGPAFQHAGVVLVRNQRPSRVLLVRVPDHREERSLLPFAVHNPVGIEDLVAAVFGVYLAEHHQLHVGGIAVQGRKRSVQVLDLLAAQRQPHVHVRPLQRGPAVPPEIDLPAGRRGHDAEQVRRVQVHAFRHPVVKKGKAGPDVLEGRHDARGGPNAVVDPPLNTPDPPQPTVAKDVRGLR